MIRGCKGATHWIKEMGIAHRVSNPYSNEMVCEIFVASMYLIDNVPIAIPK